MEKQGKIHYSEFTGKEISMILAATEKGLCWASLAEEDKEKALEKWKDKHFPNHLLIEDPLKLEPYWSCFQAYFSRIEKDFDIPLDLQGTPFQLTVWQALRKIPFGETRSYSELAEAIGNPNGVRAVGSAVGRNPVLIVVPCHRIIQKNGGLGGFSAGLPLKKQLLQHERIKLGQML